MVSSTSSGAFRHVATLCAVLAMTIFVNAQQTTPAQSGQPQQTNSTQSGQQTNPPAQTEEQTNPSQNRQQSDTTQQQQQPAQAGQQPQPTEQTQQPTQQTGQPTTQTGQQPTTTTEQQSTPAQTNTTSDSTSTSPGSQTGMQRSMAGGMGGGDLVETAMKAGNFNTLAKALEAAGLVETLKSGTYTVFAPTDEAFAKLPAGTLDDLLKPENRERLRSILTYHVVPGKLAAADLAKIDNVSTAQGTDMILMIKAKGTAVTINNATVTQPDVAASNGVVHAIDTVLMPKPMKGMSKSKNKATTGDKKMEGQTTTEGGTPQSGSSPSTSPQSGSTPSSTSPSSSTPSSSRPNSSSPNNSPSSTTQTP